MKNDVLASSALTLALYQNLNIHTAIRHLCGSGERNGAQRRTSFGRAMMQALEYCSWLKGTSPDRVTMNSEEIKSVALAIIELRLSEGISLSVNQTGSQPVSQSFSQSVKILRENSVQYNFLKISYQLSERLNG